MPSYATVRNLSSENKFVVVDWNGNRLAEFDTREEAKVYQAEHDAWQNSSGPGVT